MKKVFSDIRKFYRDKFLCGMVFCDMVNKYNSTSTRLPSDLDSILGDVVDFIGSFIIGRRTEIYAGYGCGISSKDAMKRVNQGLREAGTHPQKYLPEVWQGSFEEELLTTAFWGFTFWDEKLQERAEVGYTLDYNKVEFGTSGYSKKLNKFLPYYFTTFSTYTFMIDPIQGKVYRSDYGIFRELRVENGKLYSGKTLIAEEKENGTINCVVPFELKMDDLKKSEREKKKADGKKVKDTEWLSTELGYLRGKHKYIRSHAFILLMVFGFSLIKYALMESGSVMSIDHTNAKHNDNRVDNLALTSRSENTSKRDKQISVFDFSLFFNL